MAAPEDRGPLAETFIKIRRDRDLTQLDLVRLLKGALSSGHLGLIETGDRGIGVEKIDAISNALVLSPQEEADLRAAAKAFRERHRVPVEPAAKSGIRVPDDLDEDEQREVQAVLERIRRRRAKR